MIFYNHCNSKCLIQKLIINIILGIGDWAQSPIPNPQSPIPNPQSPKNFVVYLNK